MGRRRQDRRRGVREAPHAAALAQFAPGDIGQPVGQGAEPADQLPLGCNPATLQSTVGCLLRMSWIVGAGRQVSRWPTVAVHGPSLVATGCHTEAREVRPTGLEPATACIPFRKKRHLVSERRSPRCGCGRRGETCRSFCRRRCSPWSGTPHRVGLSHPERPPPGRPGCPSRRGNRPFEILIPIATPDWLADRPAEGRRALPPTTPGYD
jgi:hypothetical protein